MTDDERAARKWLEGASHQMCEMSTDARHRATILRLLDRPVMPKPEDVPEAALDAFTDVWDNHTTERDPARLAYRAMYAHLTAPPPKKKVEAWAVVWPDGHRTAFTYREDAEDCGRRSPVSVRVVRLVEAADANA